MSWQAMEAVQDFEGIEDYTSMMVMYAIARYADASGRTPSERDKAPSVETLAAKAKCHKNTILNQTKKLEAAGFLRVERHGKGRGRWNRYTLLVPIDQSIGTSDKDIGTPQDVPIDEKGQIIGTSNGTPQDVPITDLLVQELSAKVDLLVQVLVHNGTSQDGLVTKVTDLKKEEYIYIYPDPDPIAELKTCLSQITKTPLWDKTEDEYEQAAYMLFGWDATPESITGFGSWWGENGHYPGKPALKSLIGEYRNYLAGVVIPKGANGHANNGNAGTKGAAKDQAKPEKSIIGGQY